jgi:putative nucleotidyltransferase with HDIG domain
MQPVEEVVRGHAERVARVSGRLALAVGLTADEADTVALAGWLHDIGRLVAHPGAGGIGRRHPVIGAQLVAPFDVLSVVAPMIRHHHERLDGSGHPDGLRGDAIPVGARIIAVADAYDRLVGMPGMRSAAPEAVLERLAGEARGALDGMVLCALAEEIARSVALPV